MVRCSEERAQEQSKKIDGIDALIVAISGASAEDRRSAYDADDRAEGIMYA
jgi:hypothetical protein